MSTMTPQGKVPMSSVNKAAVRFLMAETAPNLFKVQYLARQTFLPKEAVQQALDELVAEGDVEQLGLGFYAWNGESNIFISNPKPRIWPGTFDLN